jgi:hypothetical protein
MRLAQFLLSHQKIVSYFKTFLIPAPSPAVESAPAFMSIVSCRMKAVRLRFVSLPG